MEILPAIDLVDGKCVRLIQGDYSKQIDYCDDPVEQAKQFLADGAKWLHIVDLDGAKAGRPVNASVAAKIAEEVPLQIELGGGIRDQQSIKEMLDAGLARLILGTSAIDNFDWFADMAWRFPHKLVLGLDARGSKIAVRGWLEDGGQSLLEFAQKAADLPVAAIIYTDIAKDGMLSGPNLERTAELIKAVNLPIIAAGGVTSVADIKNLKSIGASGAVIGRALYEGSISLKIALKAAE